jgi:hypothetical protein
MSIQHVLPSIIRDGLQESFTKPDIKITRFETGGRMTRTWNDNTLKAYSCRFTMMNFKGNDIANLKAFVEQIEGTVKSFWIIEPWEEVHRVPCDVIADGIKTTFVLPINLYDTIYSVLDNDAIVTAYTLAQGANLVVDDNTAGAALTVGDMEARGSGTTVERFLGDALDGVACFKVVTPATANYGCQIPAQPVSGDTEYTFHAWVKGSGTFRLATVENDSGSETTFGTSGAGSAAVWQQRTITITTQSDTTAVTFILHRIEASVMTWYTDCFGVGIGDSVRWFPPESTPGLIKFTSPPTEGHRIRAVGLGKRMTLAAINRGSISWQRDIIGHATPRTFSCLEVLER